MDTKQNTHDASNSTQLPVYTVFCLFTANSGVESGPTRAFRSMICEGLWIPYSSPDQVAGCIKWRHQQVTSLEVAQRSWEAEEDRRSRIEAQLWTLLLVFTRIGIICCTREVFIMIYVEMMLEAEVGVHGEIVCEHCHETFDVKKCYRCLEF